MSVLSSYKRQVSIYFQVRCDHALADNMRCIDFPPLICRHSIDETRRTKALICNSRVVLSLRREMSFPAGGLFLALIVVSIGTCFVAALVGYCFLAAKRTPGALVRNNPQRQMTIGVIYGRNRSSTSLQHQSQVTQDSPPPPYSTLDFASAYCSDQSKDIAIDFGPPPDYATIANDKA